MKSISKTALRALSVVLSILMLASVFASVPAFAADSKTSAGASVVVDSGKAGNVDWTFYDGVLKLSGKDGKIPDYSNEDAPWHKYADQITELNICPGIIAIGSYAFEDCFNLNTAKIVNLPYGLFSIAKYAFADSSVSSVYIPSTVNYIGERAFGYHWSDNEVKYIKTAWISCIYTGSDAAVEYAENEGFNYSTSYSEKYITDYPDVGYTMDFKSGKLSITGTGAIPDYENVSNISTAPWFEFGQGKEIKSVEIADGITVIGKNAFFGIDNLNSITTPLSTMKIRERAFAYCRNVTSITVNGSDCVIEKNAFANCEDKNMSAIKLKGVKSVGDYAFDECDSDVLELGTVEEIGKDAFNCNESITEVTIPATCKKLGDCAFNGCSKLKKAVIRSRDAEFNGENVFEKNVEIHGYLGSTAEAYATTYDRKFVSLAAPVTEGKTGDCLWSYDEPSATLTIMGDGAMADYEKSEDAPWYGYEITNITVKNGVTGIGKNAFSASKVKTFTAPDSLKTIGSGAFTICSFLESVDLNKVEKIEDSAFAVCVELANVKLDSVKTIGAGAFCFNLKMEGEITLPESCETAIGAFAYTPVSKLTVLNKNCALEGKVDETTYGENSILNTTVIRGYKGSTAEAYAKKYSRTFEEIVTPAISKTSVSLKAGKTASLTVTGGTVKSWNSSKSKVASVKNGKVTALKKGSADVTATLTTGEKLVCKVKVTSSPTIKVSGKKFKAKTTYKIKKGKTISVKITGKASSVKNKYKSSKKKIAKVTSKATAKTVKIKGLKKGKATVTLTVNGVNFKIKVKVK